MVAGNYNEYRRIKNLNNWKKQNKIKNELVVESLN